MRRGLIPAHAGKTSPPRTERGGDRAHPRSRGENSHSTNRTDSCGGSSPLTRGKRVVIAGDGEKLGLIPAHAGKTSRRLGGLADLWAHPRSRGENPRPCPPTRIRLGSSPLTRGKLLYWLFVRLRRGLIPAHAGKTRTLYTHARRTTAHPRSRGENQGPRGLPAQVWGSSPLTRGKHPYRGGSSSGTGLIPAHAGKTLPGKASTRPHRAHPRSRGENRHPREGPHNAAGSSPLTRGKQPTVILSVLWRGLIPAHAGKTGHALAAGRAHRAHPRSRGENEGKGHCLVRPRGSSPLTRGKPSRAIRARARDGLIPAHAGKTRRPGWPVD